jgi:NPCBM/NEW2 domain
MDHEGEVSEEPDSSVSSRRWRERFARDVGVATGAFGLLAALGLTLLPATTLSEKIYVLTSCLLLSAVPVAALGAWENAKQFALTLSLMFLTIVTLAALAVVAANQPMAAPNEASRQETLTPAGHDDQQSSSPSTNTPSTTTSKAPDPVYLIALEPVTDEQSGDISSPWANEPVTIGGQVYANGMTAFIGCRPVREYALSKRYSRMRTVVGLADDSHYTAPAVVKIAIDDQAPKVYSIRLGHPISIDLNVSKATRLRIFSDDCGLGDAVAFGDPQLL